ncbi:sodium-dependent serotonin transporter-like [Patiria miniata]|uniref:Transporter n=1 Tax=Patiria miniata TaxID=46514 RepID=A0A914A764_PATMI|nr:sodium-dependent serotonin transporter-like [Patiria miniata]
MASSNKPLEAQLSTSGLLANAVHQAEDSGDVGLKRHKGLGPLVSSRAESSEPAPATKAELMQLETGQAQTLSRSVDREKWDSKLDFMLSVVGFAVDLGNVWRFPYICYKNGGGAFLIPYAIMAVFGGIPLLYLELALGQYQRTGCITVWNRICPLLTGIGFAICVVNMFVSFYYNTVIAWAVYYLFSSFTSVLPWTSCNNTWNTADCQDPFNMTIINNNSRSPASEFYEFKVLGLTSERSIEDLGGVKWDLSLCLLAVYVVVFLSLWRGIKASGKVVWVTATLPYICLTVLLVRGVTLEGAVDGIIFYLNPKWELLLVPGVWMDAAVQVFFSLGPGFGVMLALSSYNKFHNNCYRDALVISAINCATSFVSGFAIFSVLGYMAMRQKTTVEEVATEGYGLVFVAYAEALATLPASAVLSVVFFLMIITLGLDSTFGGLESIITAWMDKFPQTIGKKRALFVGVLVSCCFLGSLSTVAYGGQYVIQLYDAYAVSVTILAIVALEAVAVAWCYGVRAMGSDIKAMIGHKPGAFWVICWRFLSPTAICFIVIFALVHYEPIPDYPEWAECLGWILTASSIMCVPVYAVCKLIETPGSFMQRLRASCRPQEKPLNPNCDTKGPIAYV